MLLYRVHEGQPLNLSLVRVHLAVGSDAWLLHLPSILNHLLEHLPQRLALALAYLVDTKVDHLELAHQPLDASGSLLHLAGEVMPKFEQISELPFDEH